jgi:methylmalonyl-CoA mutase N-terminal domain/subunit
MGGSWYVEWLTNELERQSWAYLAEIDKMGGAVVAIESGYMQREIQEVAWAYQQRVESGEQVIVGVNQFHDDQEVPSTAIFRVDPQVAAVQTARLQRLRQERDNEAVGSALARLRQTAEGTENLMPAILASVKAYATLGEICGVMREVFGEYHAPTVI